MVDLYIVILPLTKTLWKASSSLKSDIILMFKRSTVLKSTYNNIIQKPFVIKKYTTNPEH